QTAMSEGTTRMSRSPVTFRPNVVLVERCSILGRKGLDHGHANLFATAVCVGLSGATPLSCRTRPAAAAHMADPRSGRDTALPDHLLDRGRHSPWLQALAANHNP